MIRLLEMVARGIRTTRGLEEALGLEARTVQYYTQAADWLGLLETSGGCVLTPLGLELVYSDDRDGVYNRAVWSTPFVVGMMVGRGHTGLPEAEEIASAISASEPELSPATVRRRASAVRGLIAPALEQSAIQDTQEQLSLPFLDPPARLPEAPNFDTSHEYSPDVYRYLLGALLDYGELALAHVRALLDGAGARDAPIGGYVEMALSRGDATRVDERLVATREATLRRDLVDTTASVILSDPLYRAYLDAASRSGDRAAEIQADRIGGRYKPWDRRLFGRELQPERVQQDLGQIVLDRQLQSFPVADGPAPEVRTIASPFLEAVEQPGLPICLPPSILQLKRGLEWVNRRLRDARQGAMVGMPGCAYRPVVFHGAMLHPGEPLQRSIPDVRSLRLRVLSNAPYPALLAALLLVHRRLSDRISVAERGGRWEVALRGRNLGELLSVLDRFALSRHWVVCRRPVGGLPAQGLVDVLEALGVASAVGRKVVLAERFFAQLRGEAEEIELYASLGPLADSLEGWLVQVDRRDG